MSLSTQVLVQYVCIFFCVWTTGSQPRPWAYPSGGQARAMRDLEASQKRMIGHRGAERLLFSYGVLVPSSDARSP